MNPASLLVGFFHLYNVLWCNWQHVAFWSRRVEVRTLVGQQILLCRLTGRTSGFGPENSGSNPLRVTNNKVLSFNWQDNPLSAGWLRVRVPSGPQNSFGIEVKIPTTRYGKVGNPRGLGPRDRRFESCYLDKYGCEVKWLRCLPVTQFGAGSTPVTSAFIF